MRKFFIFVLIIVLGVYYASQLVKTGKFQVYLDTHKDSIGVEVAQYYIGIYNYERGHHEHVISHFLKFQKIYPKSKYSEEVLYRLGCSYEALFQKANAMETFNKFLEKYPNSEHKTVVEKRILILR